MVRECVIIWFNVLFFSPSLFRSLAPGSALGSSLNNSQWTVRLNCCVCVIHNIRPNYIHNNLKRRYLCRKRYASFNGKIKKSIDDETRNLLTTVNHLIGVCVCMRSDICVEPTHFALGTRSQIPHSFQLLLMHFSLAYLKSVSSSSSCGCVCVFFVSPGGRRCLAHLPCIRRTN